MHLLDYHDGAAMLLKNLSFYSKCVTAGGPIVPSYYDITVAYYISLKLTC